MTPQISKKKSIFFQFGGQTILTRSLVVIGVTPIRNVRPAFAFLSIDLREKFEILSVGGTK